MRCSRAYKCRTCILHVVHRRWHHTVGVPVHGASSGLPCCSSFSIRTIALPAEWAVTHLGASLAALSSATKRVCIVQGYQLPQALPAQPEEEKSGLSARRTQRVTAATAAARQDKTRPDRDPAGNLLLAFTFLPLPWYQPQQHIGTHTHTYTHRHRHRHGPLHDGRYPAATRSSSESWPSHKTIIKRTRYPAHTGLEPRCSPKSNPKKQMLPSPRLVTQQGGSQCNTQHQTTPAAAGAGQTPRAKQVGS